MFFRAKKYTSIEDREFNKKHRDINKTLVERYMNNMFIMHQDETVDHMEELEWLRELVFKMEDKYANNKQTSK